VLATHVHQFVPSSGDDRTLLMLHGTGGDENDLLPLGHMLVPGAALLSPRGNVLENGAPRFFRRLREGVFDLPDLHTRTRELAAFVRAAADEYHFDLSRLIAVGFSNGANIAASVLLSDPQLLSTAILFRPMVPFEPESPPDLGGKRVYIGAGETDPLVPQNLTKRLADLLRSYGADVRLDWQAGGHALTRADVAAAQEWLTQ
jgi:phospholipase/carboxylesterase